jgi:D-alanyl-D-alanine dipeptidase
MNLTNKLHRSRSTEKINYSKFQSINKQDPLVELVSNRKILVDPNWKIPGDFEGDLYADFITKHSKYNGIYVRSEVLKKLNLGANALYDPYKLVIRAGHRPMSVQKRELKECAADYKRANPGVSDEKALEHARIFVSDPDSALPPHVCGAAVDVEIINTSTGKILDFGSALNADNVKSFLYYPELTVQQKNNRLMLTTVMLDAGFASLMSEWWHYSYGDQVWAWFYGKRNSLYSPVDI